jgi:hypothetical protein
MFKGSNIQSIQTVSLSLSHVETRSMREKKEFKEGVTFLVLTTVFLTLFTFLTTKQNTCVCVCRDCLQLVGRVL